MIIIISKKHILNKPSTAGTGKMKYIMYHTKFRDCFHESNIRHVYYNFVIAYMKVTPKFRGHVKSKL